jgi:quinol monooxygenase YgiN
VFQRASVATEVASTSFRFPETKSAHLKFSPLSDNNQWRLIMFARNVTFHLKSNTHSDYTRTLENDVLPLLRKQKGFKNELTLSNPNSHEVVAISLWDSKANADAYNNNHYPEVLRTLAKMIEGTPQVNTFETVTSTLHSLVAA